MEPNDVATAGAHDVQASSLTTGRRQAKLLFFGAAFLSFLMSVYLFFSGDAERGIYVGLWVPSILSAGSLLMTRSHDG